MQRSLRKIGSKAVSLICAGALVVTLTPMAAVKAMAAVPTTGTAKDVTGVITCSSTPRTATWPEFFGLSSIDERWGIDPKGDIPGYTINGVTPNGGGLRYLLMGSDYFNTNPNPYMYNTLYNVGDAAAKVLPRDKAGRTLTKGSTPNKALGVDATKLDSADMTIWGLKPDVILGNETNADTKANTDYTSEVAALKGISGWKPANYFDGYEPQGVGVSISASTIVNMMYTVATAADTADTNNTSASLRYGSAVELVKNYEKFRLGTQGYILHALKKNNAEKKTVALVTANADGKVTISKDLTGTALLLADVAKSYGATKTSDASVTMTLQEFQKEARNIDLIVFASADDYKNPPTPAGLESLYRKMYWQLDADNGGIGPNADGLIDSASNCAKILPCLYPEYLDQSQMLAYYYETVYHIKADKIGEAVDMAMDGIRNWDVRSGSNASDYLQWTANTVSDYNKAKVQQIVDFGTNYLRDNKASMPASLQLSTQLQSTAAANAADPAPIVDKSKLPVASYRLYNKWSGEHLFTTDAGERDNLVSLGWNDEGDAWESPVDGTPVYRLYNKWSGDHHWTSDKSEVDACVAAGWNDEGIKFYTADKDQVPVYRLYNPYEKSFYHHYTIDPVEYAECIKQGWRDEAVGWYAV